MSPFRMAIVGDFYSSPEEEAFRTPFQSQSGKALDEILSDAGISRNSCFITTVFKLRPAGNSIESLCGKAKDPGVLKEFGPLSPGNYLRSEYLPEVTRLISELETYKPNVVLLLGAVATWAVLGNTAIKSIRGTVCASDRLHGIKCLPAHHPATVLRQYDLRHVTVLDFVKAGHEATFPEIFKPKREIWIADSLLDLVSFEQYINASPLLAFDIETAMDEITCVGLAPSVDRSLVIPFVDKRKPGCNYWDSLDLELSAWNWLARVLASPTPKVGQNGLYDIQWLWQRYGIPVNNYQHDTMLLHHSLFPESPKGLAFLGSVYTNESAWKSERPKAKLSLKGDD